MILNGGTGLWDMLVEIIQVVCKAVENWQNVGRMIVSILKKGNINLCVNWRSKVF